MSINLNLPYQLQDFTNGKKAVRVNGSTVGECLKHLVEQFPAIENELFDEHGEFYTHLTIFINGHLFYPERLTKPTQDGDKIDIVPVFEGG